MPPSRRKPAATPPVRRPRVAGLRKPAGSPTETTEPVEAVDSEESASAETTQVRPTPTPRPSPKPRPEPGYQAPAYAAPAVEAPADDEDAVDEVAVDEADEVEQTEAPEVAELPEVTKPSPRAKTRDEGTPKPSSLDEAETASGHEELPRSSSLEDLLRFIGRFILSIALIIVGLLLAGAAVLFHIQDSKISSATGNTALLDVARTAQVKDQVSKAAEALFSYDFNDIAKTENAAKDLLVTDGVRDKYTKLMGEVKRLAPQQKMVVTCTVTRSAVIMLNGDLAKVMVFIDQSSTRTDTKATTAGSAQLHLNAQLQGDKWKITDMDTYVAPTPPAASPSAAPPSK